MNSEARKEVRNCLIQVPQFKHEGSEAQKEVITTRPVVFTGGVGLHSVSPRGVTFLLNNSVGGSSLSHQSYLSLRSIFGPTVYSRQAAPGPELPRLVLDGTCQTRCQMWAGPLEKSSKTSDNYKMPGSHHR